MSTRREFLQTTAALGVLASTGPLFARAIAPPVRLKKAVKYGMISIKGTPLDKFELIKKLGFQGVEIDSPSNLKLDELIAAKEKTGIEIHGVVNSAHWRDPLSHPDEKIRDKGLEALRIAIKDAQYVGADTVLLVPGVVNKDVTYEECFERSTKEIRKAIPDADKAGVKIAIETVWNNFFTKPEQLVEYLDQFQTPTVGAYFDVSNVLKYGIPAATWVRKLGKRMIKMDVKGYSVTKAKAEGNEWKGFEVGIGEGEEDWPEVLKACAEVGYKTWATAEVRGGDEKWLADVSARMDKVLGLK